MCQEPPTQGNREVTNSYNFKTVLSWKRVTKKQKMNAPAISQISGYYMLQPCPLKGKSAPDGSTRKGLRKPQPSAPELRPRGPGERSPAGQEGKLAAGPGPQYLSGSARAPPSPRRTGSPSGPRTPSPPASPQPASRRPSPLPGDS